MYKILIAIVSYNAKRYMQECIYSVRNTLRPDTYKIVVVDNASTDNSYKELEKLKNEKIVVLKSSENKGYSGGLNHGCHYLIDKYERCNIFVSNPDIVIDSDDDIKKLLDTLSLDVSVVAPIVREHEGFNRGWKQPTTWQSILSNLVLVHKKVKEKLLYPEEYYNNSSL